MVSKHNVLVVDDNPDKRQLLCFALQQAGYNVHTAEDGVEGLQAVESHQPDLIITDVMMPNMDGYDLARHVRANPKTRFIPIIFQSAARRDAKDVRQGTEVGALGYVTDPTDVDLVLARARTLLEFKQYLDTCEEAAFTDHLTGLANRRRFDRQLEREVTRTLRYERPFCLLLIDIDHFKKVNDTFGHEVGDEAIRYFADALQKGTRGIDLVARIGGEEFAVILPETDLTCGSEVAERLCGSIARMEIPVVGKITASFGLAEFPASGPDGRELFASADAALYRAKNQGRNCVVCAPATPEPNHSATLGVS